MALIRININGIDHYPAEPLDDELVEESLDDHLVCIDGNIYHTDDLSQCHSCELYFVWRGDLNDELECADCVAESRQSAGEQRALESWARWACR